LEWSPSWRSTSYPVFLKLSVSVLKGSTSADEDRKVSETSNRKSQVHTVHDFTVYSAHYRSNCTR
jgi:hypothetical protein